MTKNIEKISFKLHLVVCENNLETRVIESVKKEQKKRAEIKLGLFGLSFITIGGFFVSIFVKIFSDFQSSVFTQYASILISDSKFALTNWKPTLLLLIESAPILDIFLIVTMSGILLYLLSKTTSEMSVYLRPKLIYPHTNFSFKR